MKITALILAAALTVAAGWQAAAAAEWIGPDETVAGKYGAKNLERLLEENRLAPGENIRAVTLARSERSSSLLVQVRDREPLHRHADSDITVYLLRGEGELRLGRQTIAVKAGDVMHVPRGAVHAYINRGAEPGVALVVYSPAPGPEDRVLVEEK